MRTRSGIHCCDTSQEVACESIAASRRGGIGAVRGDHVVDGCHVNAVLPVNMVSLSSHYRHIRSLTLAMPTRAAKIIDPIQCTGGPRLVHAKPNSPIVSKGAAEQD